MPRSHTKAAIACLAAVALATALLGACAASEPDGHLELWVRADASDLDGLESVSLTADWAGANSGPVRDANWRRIPLAEAQVELPGGGGDAVLVAEGAIAIGDYDRVFVSAPVAIGTTPEGSRVPLTSHIEPIARGFQVAPGERIAIEIELVVLPGSSESDGRREVFVKHAGLAHRDR